MKFHARRIPPDRPCMRVGSRPSPGSDPFFQRVSEEFGFVSELSIYDLITLWLSLTFSLIGLVQLIGPRFVRVAYQRWNYGDRVRVVTGVLDILAAVMLGIPAMRAWGIALAAILAFGSVVVFLNHRQYRAALPTVGLMLALIPATAAVPRPTQIQFIEAQDSSRLVTLAAADEIVSGASSALE